VKNDSLECFLTYADNNAVGYFVIAVYYIVRDAFNVSSGCRVSSLQRSAQSRLCLIQGSS
jgi:hypothetical protein